KAAVLALVANTAPVAFGAMATPILTLAKVTELPADTLGAMVGRQTPLLAIFVPLILVVIVDGWRAVRETWLPALICGVVFGVSQFATSNYLSVPLPAVVAGGAADEPTPEFAQQVTHPDSRSDVVKAYAPYAIIIAVFVVCQISVVKKLLDKATVKFQWPGLDVVSP